MSRHDTPRGFRVSLRAAACLTPLVLAGCAAFPTMNTATRAHDPMEATGERVENPAAGAVTGGQQRGSSERLAIPRRGEQATQRPAATEAEIAALVPDEPVDATLAPQSIPQFAATVFGGVLNLPYSLSGDVASRTDVIAGGTGGTGAAFASLMPSFSRMVLKNPMACVLWWWMKTVGPTLRAGRCRWWRAAVR